MARPYVTFWSHVKDAPARGIASNAIGHVLQKERPMRKTEIEAIGDLAGELLAAGGTLVRDMHEGIASRPFGVLGAAAAPVRVIHDGIARELYGVLRGALRGASHGGARIVAAHADADAPALASGPRGSAALAALNGLYGDHLAARGNELALGMDVRRDGADVALTTAALAAAFPDGTSRIVVFVHGLCETDDAWRLVPLRDRVARRTYGDRLQAELGLTPVYLRYNTGLRVSENGRALARLLDDLAAAWPGGVEEVVLVGHSMGGLVARSACHYGAAEGRRWTGAVRHVFCLGTPHLGADLEKGANALGWVLGRLPETRALATVLNARSAGIKDLRFGSCRDEDWSDCDPDEFLHDRCRETPFLPHAHYYFVGATLSPGPLGSMLGDLFVRMPSASGRGNGKGRSIPFEVDNGHELAGLNHFDLLNHPAVYEQLRTWLTRGSTRRAIPAVTA
jgi:pimeloyl-ACP methyl ester carboxylesterase